MLVKKLNLEGEWIEVEDDGDVCLSKSDVLKDLDISSRMLTSLYKKDVVAPKCFDDVKKHWFTEDDVETIRKYLAENPKKPTAAKPKNIDLSTQPIIIETTEKVAKLNSKVEQLEDLIYSLDAMVVDLQEQSKAQRSMLETFVGKVVARFQRLDNGS